VRECVCFVPAESAAVRAPCCPWTHTHTASRQNISLPRHNNVPFFTSAPGQQRRPIWSSSTEISPLGASFHATIALSSLGQRLAQPTLRPDAPGRRRRRRRRQGSRTTTAPTPTPQWREFYLYRNANWLSCGVQNHHRPLSNAQHEAMGGCPVNDVASGLSPSVS
jgi:hypothetical protein